MDDNPIPHPPISSELGQMFNFGSDSGSSTSHAATVVPTAPSPANLPVFEGHEDVPVEVMQQQPESHPVATRLELVPEKTSDASSGASKVQPPRGPHAAADSAMPPKPPGGLHLAAPQRSGAGAVRVAKKAAPYIVVFAIGLGIYFFYANTFSFTNLFKGGSSNQTASEAQTNAALIALKKTEANNYQTWVSQFFFNVTDPGVIDMDTDVSGNGLTNFQKYLLNLNPKMYDTLGTGISDGQEILNGNNPWTGLGMTDSQKKITENYLDTQTISDRIAAAEAARGSVAFAPYVSNNSPYYQAGVSNVLRGNSNFASDNSSNDGNNGGEVAGATVYDNSSSAPPAGNSQVPAANPQTPNNPVRSAPLTGNSPSTDVGISSLGIDTSVPGVVNIPGIKVSVPVIWSSDPKNFDNDLKKGVVHYPGTPLPGDIGTSYISGHSSGYFWDKSQYKLAFAPLGKVKNGDSFTITVTLRGGKKAILHYVVGGSAQYAANDQRQFLQSPDSVVALSTCWPINTTAKRLVVFGTLTQIEK